MSSNEFVKSVWRFAGRVAASRLGQLLFVVHLVAFVGAFAERGSPVEHPLHFTYEPPLLKALLLLDLPGVILNGVLTYPFLHGISHEPAQQWTVWISYAGAFIITSIQWWLIGYWIGLLLRRKAE